MEYSKSAAIRPRLSNTNMEVQIGTTMYLTSSGVEIVTRAPAKVNLFLEVLGRRNDGFHEIETLMVPVSLFDTLRLRPSSSTDLRLSCHWGRGWELSPNANEFQSSATSALGTVPADATNLVIKAVDRLRNSAQHFGGLDLELHKRIPAEAGMGGASSDAAAALQASNRIWGLRQDKNQLFEVATSIGSDVPFFLGGDQIAWGALCRGRGEKLTPLHFPIHLHLIVVKPPVGLSTAHVYQSCQPATEPRSAAPLIDALQSGDLRQVGTHLFNRLMEPATRLSPQVRAILDLVGSLRPVGYLMSGSGTSIYAICRSRRHALCMASQLRARRIGSVFYAQTIPVEPHRP